MKKLLNCPLLKISCNECDIDNSKDLYDMFDNMYLEIISSKKNKFPQNLPFSTKCRLSLRESLGEFKTETLKESEFFHV